MSNYGDLNIVFVYLFVFFKSSYQGILPMKFYPQSLIFGEFSQ